MTPDKVVELLVTLARESEGLARQAESAATRARDEAERYVTDSQAISLIAQYYRAKVLAALEKQLWRLTCDKAHRQAFLAHLGQSVVLYRQLVELTGRTYLTATDMITTLSWGGGLEAAEDDLALQKRFVRRQQEATRPGVCWVYADEMQGGWAKRRNYPGYLGEWFRSPEDESRKQAALGLELGLARAGKYAVWVHALIGGATPDRALVTGVNELTFPASHGEAGPAGRQIRLAQSRRGGPASRHREHIHQGDGQRLGRPGCRRSDPRPGLAAPAIGPFRVAVGHREVLSAKAPSRPRSQALRGWRLRLFLISAVCLRKAREPRRRSCPSRLRKPPCHSRRAGAAPPLRRGRACRTL